MKNNLGMSEVKNEKHHIIQHELTTNRHLIVYAPTIDYAKPLFNRQRNTWSSNLTVVNRREKAGAYK